MSERVRVALGGARLGLVRGDITLQRVDAIVNAANSGLRGGGGVDGAIHRAGGPEILEECRRIGRCPTGSAVVTGAGQLPCRWVIHAVGPRYGREKGQEAELLASAYRESLARAAEVGAQSVAFPSLSTGAYGYPLAEAAPIALGTVVDALRAAPGASPREVRFVLFGDEAFAAYAAALGELRSADNASEA